MKQNIYFRNGEDHKKKACELIDKYVEFTIIENGVKTKEIYIDTFLMQDIVEKIYSTINIKELFGEPCRIIKIEILE